MKYKPIEIGDKFGRLTVIKFDHIGKYYKRYWKCKCECGNVKVIKDESLKNGNTKSCGCLAKDTLIKTRQKISKFPVCTYKSNKYFILEDRIKCYTSKNDIFYISKESEWVLKDFCWCVDKAGYLRATVRDGVSNHKIARLHRLLMKDKLKKGFEIDHINGNKLDNRLENLRIVTHYENQWNKKRRKDYCISKSKEKRKNPYVVNIGYKNNCINLGSYPTLEEARKVRDEWEDNHERKEYFRK